MYKIKAPTGGNYYPSSYQQSGFEEHKHAFLLWYMIRQNKFYNDSCSSRKEYTQSLVGVENDIRLAAKKDQIVNALMLDELDTWLKAPHSGDLVAMKVSDRVGMYYVLSTSWEKLEDDDSMYGDYPILYVYPIQHINTYIGPEKNLTVSAEHVTKVVCKVENTKERAYNG